MVEYPNTQDAINKFGEDVIERARFNLNLSGFAGQKRNRKKNASGRLSRSLRYSVTQSNNGIVVNFLGDKEYAIFVEEGRKKGKYVPIEPLRKWIESKRQLRLFQIRKPNGVKVARPVAKSEAHKTSAAIAMSKSIQKRGIKPAPYYRDAIDYIYTKEKGNIEKALGEDIFLISTSGLRNNPNVTIR